MTPYQKVEHQDVNANPKKFDLQQIEIAGMIGPYVLKDDGDKFTTYLYHFNHSEFDHLYQPIPLHGEAGFFWDTELQKKLKQAYETQFPVSVTGVLHLKNLSKYLWIHQAKIIDGKGNLSLAKDLEGKLSVAEEGNLSVEDNEVINLIERQNRIIKLSYRFK